MFMLHVPAPLPIALPICAAKMHGLVRPEKNEQPEDKRKAEEKISAKLTDELKRKMFISCILLSPSPSSTEAVSFFIIIYLKCQYGSASEPASTCESSTPKAENRWTTIRLRYMRS